MFQQIYDDYAATLTKQWDHNRAHTVGASEIGQCARKVYWIKTEGTRYGVERDDGHKDDWGARIRGTIMEDAFWVPALRNKYGSHLVRAGGAQKTMESGYVSATPDGLVIGQPRDALRKLGVPDIKSDCFMVEGKTIDPRTNLVEAKETNIYQTQVQMGLTRELTAFKPSYDVLSYTDASFWSEVDEFVIEYDPRIYKAAHERAEEILTTSNGSDLKPEGWIAGGKECEFCPFTKACGIVRRGVPKDNAPASAKLVEQIVDLARAANKVETVIKKLEAAHKELEQRIRDTMRPHGVKRIEGVVNWFSVKAPTRYKNKEIREILMEEGYNLEEFTTIGEPSDRLVIAVNPTASRLIPKGITRKLKPQKTNRKQVNGKDKRNGKAKHNAARGKVGRVVKPAKRATKTGRNVRKTAKSRR